MDSTAKIDGPHNLIPTSAGVVGVLILLSYVITAYFSRSSRKVHRLLPGPTPKPLIGNLLDMPPVDKDVSPHYLQMGEKYGPIFALRVMGQTMVIVNNFDISRELLEKRSSKYSGRPVFTFAGELAGFNHGIIFTPANDDFRQMRKFSHSQIGSNMTLKNWTKHIDVETRRYLVRVLEQPSKFASHLRYEAGSVILKIIYGYQTSPEGTDQLVDLIEEIMEQFSDAVVPGKWIVDTLPFLKHLPEWVPGFQFQRVGRQYRESFTKGLDVPFKFAKTQWQTGVSGMSLVGASLEKGESNKKLTEHQEELLKHTAFSLYSGGADTTSTTTEVFYLAMLKFPHVLSKAQAEIDLVLGTSRLPDAADKAQLPYCEAVLKETLRWQPIGEVIMAHVNSEDDEYNGYFIPKGSYIMSNLVAITHDPKTYSEPEQFKPERFLGDKPEKDILDMTFGYGKRICPGRFLALANLWLEMSRTIACFNIKPVIGEEPNGEFTVGFLRKPKPFKADITLRSPEWEELIREVEITDPLPEEGDGKYLPSH